VRRRIWKTYRRESIVIHPPVAVEQFYWKPSEDYYLVVSALVAYKRVDSAVRVFARNGRKLRVVGDGPEYKALKRIATNNIEFCGRANDVELRALYARCRAFLMPGEEDFGITAIEALASGKPVIALGRGGALETVPLSAPVGGILYEDATDDALATAVDNWDEIEREIEPRSLQAYAARFSGAEFARKMRAVLLDWDAPGRQIRSSLHARQRG